MNKKMESWYDQEEDILGVRVKEGEYWRSIEVDDGAIVVDIDKEGHILGLEIFQASKVFSNAKLVLEAAKQEI